MVWSLLSSLYRMYSERGKKTLHWRKHDLQVLTYLDFLQKKVALAWQDLSVTSLESNMAITLGEYKRMRSDGLTPEEITSQTKEERGVKGFGTGLAKGGLSTLRGAGE